ncbi:MAG: hypothetical protein IJ658_05115 [Kiritimatiellae bacterium]|nr:hypothetical protein [Kiritimatiellia bacterium]
MRKMKVLLAGAAACLAWTACGAFQSVTVASGDSITIGVGVNNDKDAELVAEAGSTVVLPVPEGANCWVFTRLYLTGSGTVTLVAPEGDFSAWNVVFADGIAAASDNVALHVAVEGVTSLKVGRSRSAETDINYAPVDITNVTFANPNGTFGLREWVTARKLPPVFDTTTLNGIALQGKNPLRLTDTLHLATYDVVVLTEDCIPETCTVTVDPGRTFAVKPCGYHDNGQNYAYKWFWSGQANWSGKYGIVLGGKGARIHCRNNNALRLVANISGLGEIVFRPDGSNTIDNYFRGVNYRASQTTPVVVPISSATEPEPSASWQAKVTHWFDASDAATVIKYARANKPASLRYEFEGTYPVICGWTDHVKGTSDKFLFSRDAFNACVPYQLPYLVEGGLNGKDYISFGKYYPHIVAGEIDSMDCPEGKSVQRWLQFVAPSSTGANGTGKPGGNYTTLTGCKYCIMVFGSQFGGGKSILGDQDDKGSPRTTGNMARGDSKIAQDWFAYAGYSLLVDGLPADKAAERKKPNGGWQILSLDMSATNTVLDCLGGHFVTKSTDSTLLAGRTLGMTGGQNYAEIIFFDEVPTAAERFACELYLAKKWGLEKSYLPWDRGYTELSGTGTLTLDDSGWSTHDDVAEVAVAGNFAGTINVPADKTLVLADRPAPPSVYDVPQKGNLVAWFDPSLDGAIDFHVHPDATNGVARLYSRTAAGVDKTDGAYWMGMNAQAGDDALTGTGIGNPWGRYPFLTETSYLGAFGAGTPMKWMDFTQNVPNDGNGNTLRSHRLPLAGNEIADAAATPMTFRSLFMALDTSAGGGNPVGDNVSFNQQIKARASYGSDYTKPIWASGTAAMAHTWLDTNEVDGTTAGYNGRAEVLGFETAADFTTHSGLFFGYYNPNNSQKNYEHIGETLVYSTTLTTAERLAVQEYLMAKWTGDLGGKYTDLSKATVTGAGNVYSASLRNLPAFASGFTGALAGGSNMTFTVDSSWDATAAVDAIAIDRALTVDAGKVTVTLKGEAKAGTYTLLTVPSGALAGKSFDLTLENETGKGAIAKLITSDTALALEILSQSTVLLVR